MNTLLIIGGLVVSIGLLVFLTIKVKLHPFFSLVFSALIFGLVNKVPVLNIISAFSAGMGETIAGIGVVIALGTVIGMLLEKSGAAETMARTILKITGTKHAGLGLAITGYFVSIPVFCDSAYVLLSPLGKRLSHDSKISMTTMGLALAFGLHSTHVLVPPTPGPLSVAGILGADLGLVILIGMVISIPVTGVALLMASFFGRKYHYLPTTVEEIEENVKRPSALMSFAPIIVPILLMLLNTIASLKSAPFGESSLFTSFLQAVGQPVAALFVGLVIAFFTYRSIHPEDKKLWGFDGGFGEAMKTAGQIVLIVGAGGAFASVLKTAPIEKMVHSYFTTLSVGILAPFVIGAIFRTAIGSATVGMITAASMLMPLLATLGFDSTMGRVIAMLACAAGGMMVFHGNDDFFWVITSTSEMGADIAYKTIPIISVVQSLTAIACVFILQVIFL
ncbi:MAG: GntP family permease [Treponema sp.]|nr:GntP family permease [Treponema sp.]